MLEFVVKVRDVIYKKNDKEFKFQIQKLVNILMNGFYKFYNITEKIPIYINFHDFIDELFPLAMIEPKFKINKIFIEVVAAPDFEDDALEILKQKKEYTSLKKLILINSLNH